MLLRSKLAVIAGALSALGVGGTTAVAGSVDLSDAARATVERYLTAISAQDGKTVCGLLLGDAKDLKSCQYRTSAKYWSGTRLDGLVAGSLRLDHGLFRVDVSTPEGQVADTLWITPRHPRQIVKSGALLSRALGDSVAVDAQTRPLRDVDMSKAPFGTSTRTRPSCGAMPVVRAVADPAGDTQGWVTKRRNASKLRRRFDIRQAVVRVSSDGAACITIKLAAKARPGTLLELNFDDRQQRDYIDFDKDLFNATAVFGPADIASVTSSPRGIWSSAGQRTLTIGLSAGALARPGTLRITAGANDAREPLLTPDLSLSDTTTVKLPRHH